ncbi:MAG: hypothetical protein ACKVWR_14600 [Acidimicrobiales bacterium]
MIWPAALRGVVIVAPAAVLAQLLADRSPALASLLGLVVLVGLGAAGRFAAKRSPDAPLKHGAAAAALTFGVVQGVGAARRIAAGEPVSWLGFVSTGLFAACIGLLGAATVALSRRHDPPA